MLQNDLIQQLICYHPEVQILLLRFLMNIIFMTILMGTYYKVNNNSQFLFNFIVFNILIFFVASFLSRIVLETGFAFGLFAIFSILRYRTEAIPIKEMTFMFTSIIMATINSTITSELCLAEIVFANIIIVMAIFIMERKWLKNYKPSRKILFEQIELIHEDRRDELIRVLEERTGYKISDIKVNKIDYLKDTASITVYME
ncbi:MAG: DUF4956 domain-containing protein [Spirochaetales bacterium]|nr:DUF4956 domain-containing protein [Spirochaetales bacterium]